MKKQQIVFLFGALAIVCLLFTSCCCQTPSLFFSLEGLDNASSNSSYTQSKYNTSGVATKGKVNVGKPWRQKIDRKHPHGDPNCKNIRAADYDKVKQSKLSCPNDRIWFQDHGTWGQCCH